MVKWFDILNQFWVKIKTIIMKKKLRVIFTVMLTVSSFAYSQTLNIDFLYKIDGNNYDEVHQVAIDNQGNIFMTGFLSGTNDFDYSISGVSDITTSNRTPFIAKYTNNGEFLWVKSFPNTLSGGAIKVDFDASNNVYLSALCMGNIDLDPGPGVQIANIPYGSFLVKLNPNGDFQDGFVFTTINDVKIHNGNLYLVGEFGNLGDPYDFNLGSGVNELSALGGADGKPDGYILKLDLNLNFVEVKHLEGLLKTEPKHIDFDANGRMVVAGTFEGGLTAIDGTGNQTVTSNGSNDVFYVRYTSTGDLIEIKNYGNNTDWTNITDLHISNNNSIYISGLYTNSVDFNTGSGTNISTTPGSENAYIIKLDANGNYEWTYTISNTNWVNNISELDSDSDGNIYFTGNVTGSNLDLNPNGTPITLPGFNLAFIIKLNASGIVENAYNVGNENGTSISPKSIKLSGSNIIIGGSFNEGAIFLGNNENITLSTNGDAQDGFLVKYSKQPLSIDMLTTFNDAQIFPNPAQDIITISELPLGAELSILDITGKVMFSTIVNSNQLIVNTDEFSNGIYLVNVNTNGSTTSKKLAVYK
jgi:hypothetical protein